MKGSFSPRGVVTHRLRTAVLIGSLCWCLCGCSCQAAAELQGVGKMACLGTCQQEADELARGVGSASLDLILCWVCWWRPCDVQVWTPAILGQAPAAWLLVLPAHGFREATQGNRCLLLCEHSAWLGIKHERTWPASWAETPTDRVPGIVQVFSLPGRRLEGKAMCCTRCCIDW